MNIAGIKLTQTDVLIGGSLAALLAYFLLNKDAKAYANRVCSNGRCWESEGSISVSCVNGVCTETEGDDNSSSMTSGDGSAMTSTDPEVARRMIDEINNRIQRQFDDAEGNVGYEEDEDDYDAYQGFEEMGMYPGMQPEMDPQMLQLMLQQMQAQSGAMPYTTAMPDMTGTGMSAVPGAEDLGVPGMAETTMPPVSGMPGMGGRKKRRGKRKGGMGGKWKGGGMGMHKGGMGGHAKGGHGGKGGKGGAGGAGGTATDGQDASGAPGADASGAPSTDPIAGILSQLKDTLDKLIASFQTPSSGVAYAGDYGEEFAYPAMQSFDFNTWWTQFWARMTQRFPWIHTPAAPFHSTMPTVPLGIRYSPNNLPGRVYAGEAIGESGGIGLPGQAGGIGATGMGGIPNRGLGGRGRHYRSYFTGNTLELNQPTNLITASVYHNNPYDLKTIKLAG